jgi:DNA-binding NarL/FixJ family response regulator
VLQESNIASQASTALEAAPPRRARILIADDHVLTRAGLRAVLADDPQFELVGEAINGGEAVEQSRALQPDLVLMDVRMPDMDGLQATRILKQASPTTTVLILSMFEDAELLLEAVKAGAAGYVLKNASEPELRAAMSDALAGNFPVDRHLVRDVLRRVANEKPAARPSPPPDLLSSREREVLELLARGCTNREIAEQLVITSSTVKVHVEHILAKLGVSDRTQAAVHAIELGYVTPLRPNT